MQTLHRQTLLTLPVRFAVRAAAELPVRDLPVEWQFAVTEEAANIVRPRHQPNRKAYGSKILRGERLSGYLGFLRTVPGRLTNRRPRRGSRTRTPVYVSLRPGSSPFVATFRSTADFSRASASVGTTLDTSAAALGI